jgi:ABC-type uncharacterized transport system permease subunit
VELSAGARPHLLPEGWHAILLIPVLLFIGWGAFALSPIIENAFMHGDSRIWLTHDMGIKFDQRNSWWSVSPWALRSSPPSSPSPKTRSSRCPST